VGKCGGTLSRGFISAIAGIAVTLFSWYGPWAWPAWPAFTVIQLVFGHEGFAELSYNERAATIVMLIVVNVAFWGLVMYGFFAAFARIKTRSSRLSTLSKP
jgi:hypothetical protein